VNKRAFKNELFGHFATIGRALASGPRLELLELLAQKECTVEELAGLAELSVANASQHLKVLRSARLVDATRHGVHVRYRLADERVFRMWQALRDLGEERLADIDRLVQAYISDRDSLQPMSISELRERLKDRSVILLDVRPAEEFQAGHIRGARSVPVSEVRQRLAEFPKGRTIVAYCRGPYCVFADEAVALLRANGRRALRLAVGFPDWKVEGLPIEAVPGINHN
jgi:rhodanese-related sulfurtransferase